MLFDLVVGASSIYGGSWLEGAGAVYAENQALRWIADLAGLPDRGRRLFRLRRHDREPVGAGRRPPHRPAAARRRRARPRLVPPPTRPTPRSCSAAEVMDVESCGVAPTNGAG